MALSITTVEIKNKPDTCAAALTVAQTAATQVTVSSGSFKMAGVSYTLPDDAVFTLTQRTNKQWINGYLVKEVATGDIELLVDEYEEDGVDEMYIFDGTTYELLHTIFTIQVPANDADLNSSSMEVRHVVAPGE